MLCWIDWQDFWAVGFVNLHICYFTLKKVAQLQRCPTTKSHDVNTEALNLLFPGESCNVLETSYYGKTCLCWPSLVPFKATQLIKVATSCKPLEIMKIWLCFITSANLRFRVQREKVELESKYITLSVQYSDGSVENCAVLGYYATSSGNFWPVFWDSLSSWPLKMGLIFCHKMSERN